MLQSREHKNKKEYWKDFFQYETALLCSIYLHEPHNYADFLGKIGSEYIGNLISSSKSNIINIANKKVRNGWDVNYKNSMFNFDLLETDPGLAAGLKITSAGEALAKAYADTIGQSPYIKDYIDAKEVPVDVLRESSKYLCPCAVHNPFTKKLLEERSSIARILLSKKKKDSNERAALIDSIDLIIQFMKTVNDRGIGFTELLWRRTLSTGNFIKKETFQVPERCLPIYRKWELYNLDSLFAFSLESALCGFLEFLHSNNNLRKEDVLKKLDEMIAREIRAGRDSLLKPIIAESLEFLMFQNPSHLFDIEEKLIRKIAESKGLEKIRNAFSLCIYVIALFNKRANRSDYIEVLTYFKEITDIDGYELSLLQAANRIQEQECRSFFNNQYIQKWLIQRQLNTRFKRNKDVAWFLYAPETGCYSWEANYRPNIYRASRTGILMSFLFNINVVRKKEKGWYLDPSMNISVMQ